MVEGHQDIFHCLKCGRLAYEPHGTSPPPACCGQPMVRAVAAVTTTGPPTERVGTAAEEVEEYALLAEAMELSNWSRTFPVADVSRYEELAQRLAGLATAVADRFQNEDRAGELAKAVATEPTQMAFAQQLRGQEQPLLAAFHLFVDDLRVGPTRFRGWAEVCDRLDALALAFRRHEEVERDLLRPNVQENAARPS